MTALKWTKLRWFVYPLLGLLLITGILVMVLRLNTHDRVNGRNYAKIRAGMLKAEVEAILGDPLDILKEGVPLNSEDIHADETLLPKMGVGVFFTTHHWWRSKTRIISITFDAQDRVVAKSYSRDPEVGVLHRVIDWLGL